MTSRSSIPCVKLKRCPAREIPVAQLVTLLTKKSGYVVVNNQLDLSDGRRINNDAFPESSSSRRRYVVTPTPRSPSHARRRQYQGVGTSGLEYEYKSSCGSSGETREFVSASGVNLPGSHSTVIKKATPGVGLELTIDSSLQFVTERALAKQLKATNGVTGVAVVMDVKTGQILADASLVNTTATPVSLARALVGRSSACRH